MAALQFDAIATRAVSASAASIAPVKPSVRGNGGLLLAVVTSKNNAVHSTATSGWSLVQQVNSGAAFTASLWIAAETAGAPTFTWTGAAAASAQIAYYVSPNSPADTATVGASTSNSGSANPHSTTAIVSTRNESLFAYIDVAGANTALAAPSGWTENNDTGSATDAGRTVFGSKAAGASGTSSGAISVTGAAADWVQWQVELMLEVPPPGAGFSKAEVGAWVEPPDGFDTSKVEVGAWLDANTVGFSKVEVGAWLDAVPILNRRRALTVMRR